ncbi:MAG: hypothetical protein JWP27_1212 [Flaviaesturariibacter sp.]|nr:hypothetical protein [Flaviaesturariibacter sp.]
MMKTLLLSLLLLMAVRANSQPDYSGHYGYRTNPLKKEDRQSWIEAGRTPDKSDRGPIAVLNLLRLSAARYKFWLYVDRGYPGYNSGEIEGVLTIRGTVGFFTSRDTVLGTNCRMRFHFAQGSVEVADFWGEGSNCGFGANVTATGAYPRIDRKPVTTTDIQLFGQEEQKIVHVISKKAMVYGSPSGKPTGAYFIKGDSILQLDEANGFVFTEYISAKGKYVEGWIRKEDLD